MRDRRQVRLPPRTRSSWAPGDEPSTISSEQPLVLASASPRRRDILRALGIPFRVLEADVDERLRPGEDPTSHALRLAASKAERVGARLDAEGAEPGWVLGADTVVSLSGLVLGKPADDDDALRMLRVLAGKRHEVTTAFAVRERKHRQTHVWQVTSVVTFCCLSHEQMRRYVATGEGRDKAGGYAAQGLASGFIREIRGSYSNVVGLPAAELVGRLLDLGALEEFPA